MTWKFNCLLCQTHVGPAAWNQLKQPTKTTSRIAMQQCSLHQATAEEDRAAVLHDAQPHMNDGLISPC